MEIVYQVFDMLKKACVEFYVKYTYEMQNNIKK